jgi:RHS repeat-associated protein
LGRHSQAAKSFHRADALGSTLALTSDAGAVTTTYAYEPFGKTTITGTSTNPFQYTGRDNEGATLYYYRGRYYSPVLSRFLSEDPLHFKDGINAYVYTRNNPLAYLDPLGLTERPVDGPLTSGFGNRTINGKSEFHNGADYENGLNEPVRASDSGFVSQDKTGLGTGPNGENQVKIDHPGDGVSGYSHVTPTVQPGQYVQEGEIIGYTDMSGRSSKPHLHYTFRPCRTCDPVDPETHLPPRKASKSAR